jgi:asparagine synthase (glutamine-hydrolysing)
MCGIFGTNRVDRWVHGIPEVGRRLSSRGPDALANWTDADSRATLVHARLEVIGGSTAGVQPFTTADGTLTVAFNGEIYNYKELRSVAGVPVSGSDTEVLAELLRREGPAAVSRLRGMYAFVAWDSAREELLAGRDNFGIKPLYVLHHADGGVALSSTIPPLLVDRDARAMDPVGIAHYLAFGHTSALTTWRSISKLAPGAVATWSDERGFSVTRPEAPSPVPVHSVDEMVDITVGEHLVADVEVGVFLSGGVDSTLIAAAAVARRPDLRTFTLSFPESPSVDESLLAERNARLLGSRHTTVPVTARQMADAVPGFLAQHGEPFGDAAALPLSVLAERARGDLKVVLTGEGADEIFGGYRRYEISERVNAGPIRWIAPAGRPVGNVVAGWRTDRPLYRAIEAALYGGGFAGHAALLGSDLAALLRTGDPHFTDVARVALSDWFHASSDRTAAGEVARRFDMLRLLPNGYLEKVDRATMQHGLEARVPYLHSSVATYAAQSKGRSLGKGELRGALFRRLPGVELPSRKKGLAVDIPAILRAGLDMGVRYELDSEQSIVNSIFSPTVCETLRHRASRSPTSAFRLAMLGSVEANLEVRV